MAINIVQSGGNSATPGLSPSSSGPVSVAVTLGSSVSAGDMIFVAVAAIAPATFCSVDTPSVTDSLGNTYTQATWADASNQTPAQGWFYSQVTTGGSCTITFHAVATNGNTALGENFPIALAAGEFSGFGSAPTLQASQTLQQGFGVTNDMSITLTPSVGANVKTDFGTTSEQSCAVVDFSALSVDYFLACTSSGTAAPTVTGASWTYALQENPASFLSMFIRGVPVTTITSVQPQIFVVT